MKSTGETEVLEESPVPVPLCPPQIPHGLTGDRTRACAVGGRQLQFRVTFFLLPYRGSDRGPSSL
jgi:hypothetical protein